MRIIAGEWRGRRLLVPPDIRPMLERERVRLFGILGDRVEGAAVLDLFAGSGAIGLEALSRGARLCTAVENGHRVLPALRQNVDSLGAAGRYRLLPISAFGLPKSGEPGRGTVDIAVCAPPFPLLEDLAMRPRFHILFGYIARDLLAPGGVFVLEHPADLDPGQASGLGPSPDTRRTASSALSLWRPASG